MNTWAQVAEVVVWPITIIVVVALLRKPLMTLIPTLKRFKYKDLELEFEREASKILAEVERDLPAPKYSDGVAENGPDIMFRRSFTKPTELVMSSWGELEQIIRSLVGQGGYEKSSVRSLVDQLAKIDNFSVETIRVILDLAALRNRVSHAEVEAVSPNMAQTYAAAVRIVKAVLSGVSE